MYNLQLSDTDVKLSVCVSDVDEGFALKQEDLDRMRTIDGYFSTHNECVRLSILIICTIDYCFQYH